MLYEISQQVQLLTSPNRHEHWVPRPIGGLALHTSFTPPLLDQLREAIKGNNGGYGRGGTEKRARAVMDSAALEEFNAIQSEIHEMLVEISGAWYTGLPPGESKDELRRWLRLYTRQVTTGYTPIAETNRVRAVHSKLAGWSTSIQDKFNPSRQKEILVNCPECGERYAQDKQGDRVSALVAVFQPQVNLYVRCRNCNCTWTGSDIRVLGELTMGEGQKVV